MIDILLFIVIILFGLIVGYYAYLALTSGVTYEINDDPLEWDEDSFL